MVFYHIQDITSTSESKKRLTKRRVVTVRSPATSQALNSLFHGGGIVRFPVRHITPNEK